MAEFRLGRLKFNWRGDWTVSTAFVIDDIIKYGANTYVCKVNHTSSGNENLFYSADFSYWSLHTEGIVHKGDWVANTWYKLNDIYKYGNTQYRVTTAHTSGADFVDSNHVKYVESFNFEDTWNTSTQYQEGDVVTYGGYTYVAKALNTNKPPAYNDALWDVITTGFNVVGEWNNSTAYVPGDVVQYGGNTYVATTNSTNIVPTTTANWKLVSKGINWRGNWDASTTYQLGDTVKHLSNSYIGVATAGSTGQDPSTDSNGDYWNQLVEGAANNVMTTKGDMVFYNTGAARLPIGTNGQALVVSETGVPQWEDNGVSHPVFYVTEEGSDTNDGSNIGRSFASVKHACREVGLTTNRASIYVKAGTYNEQLPIVVPEGVSIVGDNLRSTKIRPKSGVAHQQHLTLATAPSSVSYGSSIFTGDGTKCASILDSSYDEKTIEIRCISGGLWDTNDTWEDGVNDIAITNVETRPNEEANMFLMSNASMLKDILMENLTGFEPAGIVTTRSVTISDTIMTGNDFFPDLVGTTVVGAGISVGTKVSGFVDSTTIEVDKPQTVSSATSVTFEAQDYDPNNAKIRGVFVALNPESRIIKSPYVSNCSASSVKGIGAVVDGGVHRQFVDGSATPSNKSIVFDSFTNIHDEGIGFWITDGAVAETVSCFTYYCHTSYAATRGGRLRSLVGNSSWGKYGVVSSGFSPLEIPREGQIEGLVLEFDPDSLSGNFQQGERIRGGTSEAIGQLNSIQGALQNNLYYSVITEGAVGVGTGFAGGEVITGQTSGATATLRANGLTANRGQNGFALVLSGLGTNPPVTINGSIEFETGSGNGGFNGDNITGADPFTFVISGVSQLGPTGKGNIVVDRGQWTTSGAAHTGGNTSIIKYPIPGDTTTFLTPAAPSENVIQVGSISGFTPGGYALSPTGELMKINSFPTANSMNVDRAQDGAATAGSYSIGDSIVAVGTTSYINTAEINKDFTGVSTQFRATISQLFAGTEGSYLKIDDEFVKVTGITTDTFGLTTVTLVEEKAAKAFDEQDIKIRYIYSQARLTGHDFLQVGTGGTYTTNWPAAPINQPVPSYEITEEFPGRVFYVSTDNEGNFRVGKYFKVNQATGSATLNASAFDLSGLTSLRLGSIGAQLGAQINEFSTDGAMSQNSNEKVPTQAAVRTYVGTQDAATLLAAQNAAQLGIATATQHASAGVGTAISHANAGIGTLRTENATQIQASEYFISQCIG